jgi:hypothetical protein
MEGGKERKGGEKTRKSKEKKTMDRNNMFHLTVSKCSYLYDFIFPNSFLHHYCSLHFMCIERPSDLVQSIIAGQWMKQWNTHHMTQIPFFSLLALPRCL